MKFFYILKMYYKILDIEETPHLQGLVHDNSFTPFE